MRTQVLVRNRASTGVLLTAALALALALIAVWQGLPRLSAPSIPLMDQRVAPSNVETTARPAAPATVAPGAAPLLRAPAGGPTTTALPAPLPKAGPADGRPMGDLDPPPPSNRAWKGGFDY